MCVCVCVCVCVSRSHQSYFHSGFVRLDQRSLKCDLVRRRHTGTTEKQLFPLHHRSAPPRASPVFFTSARLHADSSNSSPPLSEPSPSPHLSYLSRSGLPPPPPPPRLPSLSILVMFCFESASSLFSSFPLSILSSSCCSLPLFPRSPSRASLLAHW